jgi:predicted NACHT family NTPase
VASKFKEQTLQAKNIRTLNVFISCPREVEEERKIAEEVCEQLTKILGPLKNIEIVPIHWEKDVVPVITGESAQPIINDQINRYDYDIYIGILWTRFGDRQANGMTPTEEEFEIALANRQKKNKPIIQFYFKCERVSFNNPEQARQMLEVLEFKKRIRKLGITVDFEDKESFRKKLLDYLPSIIKECDLRLAVEPKISKTIYYTPGLYLPRRVCLKKDYTAGRNFYLWDKYAKDTLDIISDNKRVAIVSDAGMGKTTELQRIAGQFSKVDSPFYPFLISLNKYVNQSLSELLPLGWEEVPKSRIAVILDGLDEIESKNKRDAIRQIELFSEQYPETHIIVSCRTNFYESEAEKSSGTLNGFFSYMLLELSRKEIEDYVKGALDGEAESFHKDVLKNRLHELLQIPFYLVRLVELFKKNHALPSHKAEIFEQLLIYRIEQDIEHYRTTMPLREKQKTVVQTLQRLALGIEILGRNYISNDEYCQIIDEEPLRKLIEHCTLWKKDDSENLKWQFEHNNFQEYLAARCLANKSLSILKDIMFFEPDHTKLIPSWSNTLSFLISISDDSDLIHWIIKNEPELAVKFEPDRLELETRIKIFKGVFNYYKEKQIWIDRDKFRYDELSRCGQSNEIVEYILDEAEKAEHYTTACNAIELLSYLKIPHNKRDLTSNILVNYAITSQFGDQVQNRAMMALADLKLNSLSVINKVTKAVETSGSEWIRYGLYYFLHNSNYLDENIDIFINGFKYLKIEISPERSRLADESWHLRIGLEKAKSPEAIDKILKYFIEYPNDPNDLIFEKIAPIIAENAAEACLKKPSLFQIAVKLFETLVKNSLDKQAQQFAVFFDKTKTRQKLFCEYILRNIDERDYWAILALLADEHCLEVFIQQYQKGKLGDNDVLSFRNYLAWKNSDLHFSFNDLINVATNNKFPLPQERDYEKERKDRIQRDIALLFNKFAFLADVKLIFDTESKLSFTESEILELQSSHWDNPYFSNLVIKQLRRLAKEEAVTYDNAVNAINNWDWEWFCICNIYDKLNTREDIKLTEKQKDWIAQWCYSNLTKVDFKKALETKEKGSTSASWHSIFLWYFLRKLSLNYPKEVLLDMISFDWIEGGQYVGIQYLETLLDKSELTIRVLQNLEKGIQNDDILKNHFDYCKRHRIEEALPFCLSEIIDSERGEDLRGIALETICDLSPTAQSDLEKALEQISDDFKWNVIGKLLENHSKVCHEYLLSLLQTGNDEEKLRSAQQLIKLQDTEGLNYYVDWVKKHRKSPGTTHYHDKHPLVHLQIFEAVPYLTDLLEVCYQPGFKKTGFDYLEHHVLDALTTIALQGSENYQGVRKRLEDFIEQNTGKLRNVNFLNAFIEKLDQKYYMTKSEGMSISDVKAKLETVLSNTPSENKDLASSLTIEDTDAIQLKPNIFGIGIDLNYIIKKLVNIFRRKDPNK